VTGGGVEEVGSGVGEGVVASINRPSEAADCGNCFAPITACVPGIGLSLKREAGRGDGGGEGRKEGATEAKREGEGGSDDRRGQVSCGCGAPKEEVRTLTGGSGTRTPREGPAVARLG
jgi:hypothetical protein